MDDLELTILMPCLNEALTLATCIRKARGFLARCSIRGEVVIADNGSTDGSQDIARKEGARVIHVPVRGYGAALIAGTRAARGRYVIMGDSDDSYDFERLDVFMQALREGNQLVMGNRFKGGIRPGAMPALHRYLGNPVLSFLGRLFFQSPIRDFHCGLRGYDRQAVLGLDLSCPGMEYASEMIVRATIAGLRIVEVPTTLSPDGRDRPPHLRSWSDGWRHLRFMLLHAPQWLFFYPGMLLSLLGCMGLLLLAAGPIHLGRLALDIHSLVFAMVVFSIGLQMVTFAAVASSHLTRRGLLHQLPFGLRWVEAVSLERFLVCALALIVSGLVFSLASLTYWKSLDFGQVDPQVLMRIAVPAGTLLQAGLQMLVASFLVEYVRAKSSRQPSRACQYGNFEPPAVDMVPESCS